MSHYSGIYIYAFSRCLYLKLPNIAFKVSFYFSSCILWESNPWLWRCMHQALLFEECCRKAQSTCMHLVETFIQSHLHCIQVILFISSRFEWESNPWLACTMLYCMSNASRKLYSYMYALGRLFYRLTLRYTVIYKVIQFISSCIYWESNPWSCHC